jgi:hypothetical protein
LQGLARIKKIIPEDEASTHYYLEWLHGTRSYLDREKDRRTSPCARIAEVLVFHWSKIISLGHINVTLRVQILYQLIRREASLQWAHVQIL